MTFTTNIHLSTSSLISIAFFLFSCCNAKLETQNIIFNYKPRAYYINENGNDENDGSKLTPWKSFLKIKNTEFHPGDSILLKGGQVFVESLQLNYFTEGTSQKPIIISSYGVELAAINSNLEQGIVLNNCNFIILKNIKIIGVGRKKGNITDGVILAHCQNISIYNLDISGYQKSGLHIQNCQNINVTNVYSHDNGYAGISVDGENFQKTDCRNIELKYCKAENNPGDPTNLVNHSGNGIVISQCTNAKISYCLATNNGWDMPRKGNGPVGIWAWEADSIIIDHCLSYKNKTSIGGEDGGGFDLDGGITNSILQYCLSYENEGSGIGLFQYKNASAWKNNTIRYNISINDGNISSAKAGLYLWNSTLYDPLEFCYIYNNTIYNNKNAALKHSLVAKNKNIFFLNNILVGKNEIIAGNDTVSKYLGNCWYSLNYGFYANNTFDFNNWRIENKQEVFNGSKSGININPSFTNINNMTFTDVKNIDTFSLVKAKILPFLNDGIDKNKIILISSEELNFNGNRSNVKNIGASF